MPDLTASATDSSIQYPTWNSVDSYAAHNESLRRAEEKFQQERDRRYTEALRDHQAEHSKALVLARETLDKALTQARESMERALVEAKQDIERRLEKLNELRGEVIEDRAVFLRREIFDAAQQAMLERIGALDVWRATLSSLDSRLDQLNHLRAEVIKDRENYLRQDVFETRVGPGFERVTALETWRATHEGDNARFGKVEDAVANLSTGYGGLVRRDVWEQASVLTGTRLTTLEQWKAKALGFQVIASVAAGLVGAAIMRAVLG